MTTLEQLGMDRLSPAERFSLAQQLWDSVHDSLDSIPLATEIQEELARKMALADADPDRGVSWETVKAEARARWGK